ncbi:MAG: type III polyketide synthase [Candidatus Poribacteria bacterium]|nr:type III polyketide synthase [Candidatus Poribacteria bacterium]
MPYTVMQAIGTAVPQYRYRQTDIAQFMKDALGADAALSRRIDYLYRRSQIGTRHSCIPIEFYLTGLEPQSFPTTQDRMAQYQTEALPLCKAAIADALNQPHAPDLAEVTHLVVVSCTGFYAPGLDIHLVQALGLSPDVQRTVIGFMGCYAAFNGIRLADAICRSDPDATVLLVCVELCSLHFQRSPAPEHLIANCIFADGAAAVFFQCQSPLAPTPDCFLVKHSLSWLDNDSLDEMTWTIGNTGFEMYISPTIAKILDVNLPDFIQRLLKPSGLGKGTIDFWAVHSGGRSILDTVQVRLDLPAYKLEDSRTVLHDYGNMSSPSVLFVLKRLLERSLHSADFRHCVAMAFGPGLTLEGCLFEAIR